MDNPLAVYLHDHLAGSRLAVDLLDTMKSDYAGEPLGRFAEELLRDVDADRSTLQDLVDRVGRGSTSAIKEGFAWAAEKATWMKLRRTEGGALGPLLSLESLAVGIHGKLTLWETLKNLHEMSPDDGRLAGLNFDRLIARAKDQRDRLEDRRLKAAREVLRTSEDIRQD